MMDIPALFPSETSKENLLYVQKHVSNRAVDKDDFATIRFIGGVDQAFFGLMIIYLHKG